MIHPGTCSWVYVCHTHCAYVHLACKPSDQACTATQLAALQWSEAHNGSKEGTPRNEEGQQTEGYLVSPPLPKQSTSMFHTHVAKLIHTM